MTTGFIVGEPIEVYHANDATSHSRLEVLRDRDRGTLKYYARFIAKTSNPRADKDCFDVGSGIDALLLEGDAAFQARTWIAPEDFRWSTAEGKALVAAQRRSGRVVLSHEEAALVHNLRRACLDNPTLKALLASGQPQVTIRHGFGKFYVQVRPDWLNTNDGNHIPGREEPVGPYMVDLKSAEDVTRFFKMLPSYYRAAALYREIYRLVVSAQSGTPLDDVPAPAWFWAVVFKTDPICAVVYEPDAERLIEATREVTEDVALLKQCYETGNWRASVQGVQTLPGRRF